MKVNRQGFTIIVINSQKCDNTEDIRINDIEELRCLHSSWA